MNRFATALTVIRRGHKFWEQQPPYNFYGFRWGQLKVRMLPDGEILLERRARNDHRPPPLWLRLWDPYTNTAPHRIQVEILDFCEAVKTLYYRRREEEENIMCPVEGPVN